MPDLITHISVASILFRVSRASSHLVLFLLGTTLPDLLTRTFYILFPVTKWLLTPFHTPIGFTLVSLLAALFFAREIRAGVFFTLLAGGGLHMFLDAFQVGVGGVSYLWAFPFHEWSETFGFIGPEDSLYAAPFLLCAAIALEIAARQRAAK
ncbi:zinc dependent phospholipase C family protein [Thermodesulfobacteriota bacterium]